MFWTTLKNLFKKYFIAGTIVIIPVAGTILILKAIIVWSDDLVVSLLPSMFQPSFISNRSIPGIGLVLTMAVILLVGIFTRLYLGKKLITLGDKIISAIPFGSSIYATIKQILKTALTSGSDRFKGVCIVEFPMAGSYSLAFVTGESSNVTSPDRSKKHLTVFVPTSPNPTSGYMLILPEEKVKIIDMSVEDASKMIISGGLIKS